MGAQLLWSERKVPFPQCVRCLWTPAAVTVAASSLFLLFDLGLEGFFLRALYPHRSIHEVLGLPLNQAVGFWRKKRVKLTVGSGVI